MIIVAGWVRVGTGEVERLRDAIIRMVEATRREPGCLDYALAVDFEDPQLLRVSERWADERALAAHFATAHVAAFNALLATAAIEGASIHAYEATHKARLMGKD